MWVKRYELRIKRYELLIKRYELLIRRYELLIKNHFLQSTIVEGNTNVKDARDVKDAKNENQACFHEAIAC